MSPTAEIDVLLHHDMEQVYQVLAELPLASVQKTIPSLIEKAASAGSGGEPAEMAFRVRALASVQILLARIAAEIPVDQRPSADPWAVSLLGIITSAEDPSTQQCAAQALSVAIHSVRLRSKEVYLRALRILGALAEVAPAASTRAFASSVCSDANLGSPTFEGIQRGIDRHALGQVEAAPGTVSGRPSLLLKEVVVVADQVESPNNALRTAVWKNLRNKVRYTFLVSKGRTKQERKRYFQDFATMARVLAAQLKSEGIESEEIEGLIGITDLPYNWSNYPYIFYRLAEEAGTETMTLAFRGSDRASGISTCYYQVAPQDAHTIARTLFMGAPARHRTPSNKVRETTNRLTQDNFAVPKLTLLNGGAE